jgi:dynein light chain LC8-type
MTTLPPATVKSVGTMSKDMEAVALQTATEALERFNTEKDMASFMKKEFDRRFSPTWHCFVGRNFGSYVTHETNHFAYFYVGQTGFLIFKSG